MKLKLDGWKKHSADKDYTILQNEDGHQIKVVHVALSPKIRGQLAALPMMEKEKESEDLSPKQPGGLNMADGGQVKEDKDTDQELVDSTKDEDLARMVEKESLDKDVPMYADGGSTSAEDSPEQIAADAAKNAPPQAPVTINIAGQGGNDAANQGAPQQPQAQPAPQAPSSPDQGGSAAPQFPAPITPQQAAAQGAIAQAQLQDQVENDPRLSYIKSNLDERDAFMHDLRNGHITPETYGQLADKGSLGRIGTMFGLILGGIGSGITGQPNTLLSMMDKEIDRDLKAQQDSKSNAQNLYNLTTQRVGAESAAGQTNIDTATKAYALAKMNYQQLALHDLIQKVQKMPPGPMKQQAQQALALMAQQINQADVQIADKLYTMEQLGGPTNEGNAEGQKAALNAEQQFQSRNRALVQGGRPDLAQFEMDRHIPGVPGSADRPVPQANRDEIQAMNVLDKKASDILNFAKAHKGTLSPSQRAIGAQKAEEMINFYNNSIKGGVLTEGRLEWLDKQIKKNPTSIFQDVLGNNARLEEIQRSNNDRRAELLKSLGYSSPSVKSIAPSPATQTAGPSEGSTAMSKSGRPMVFKAGKWHYK